jgi:carboxyl-terminal processing protease
MLTKLNRFFFATLCAGLLSGLFVGPAGYCAANPSVSPILALNSTLDTKKLFVTLQPRNEDRQICLDIVEQLTHQHYNELALDDFFSTKVFDRFLSDLDSNRIYFTRSDLDQFESYRFKLDNALRSGDVKPSYLIFNRYRQRLIERLVHTINLIEHHRDQLDFTIAERLEADRKTAPWPEDRAELQSLWRKWLKNDILVLKLAGKDEAEITKLLDRRYRSRLNRVIQMVSEDAFIAYINSLTHSHDPHTQYFSRRMTENFNIRMSLSLEGIGAVLQTENEYTKVVRLIPAGPAEKAGELKPGDQIVGVGQGSDGEIVDVVGWRIEEVVQLIRGPRDTVVRLEIIPADAVDESQRLIIAVTRNKVKLEEQAARGNLVEVARNGRAYRLGIIEIPTFYKDFEAFRNGDANYRSVTQDVRRLLTKLNAEGVDGIIIDLRDNGGGALEEASALTGLFIPTGPTVQVRSHNGRITKIRDRDPQVAYAGRLVVLVNRLTASASEIFSGAIQDYGRGIIIGGQTFGKGTVQSVMRIRDGQLKFTIAKYYRISGSGTQYRGIMPDIVYPAIYDKQKIGESAYPEALAWDTIRPARYEPLGDLAPLVNSLNTKHQQRIKTSKEFEYLMARLAYQKDVDSYTRFSLAENTRRQERNQWRQKRLQLENQRRALQGLDPLRDADELEPESTTEGRDALAEKDTDALDPLMSEAHEILVDYIQMTQNALASQ